MKNFKKKLSAIVLSTVFASMQVGAVTTGDIGLGNGNGGAVINSHSGGLTDIQGIGTNNVDLNFNASTHVKWDTLNVNAGEKLNFNATGNANNLTILNTVQNNMTNIYGQINTNSGIGKLILSNPNGVFFDGARFTTAADTDITITTKDMSAVNINNLNDGSFTKLYDADDKLIPVKIINGSQFNVGGDYTIVAPMIDMADSTITANTLKLITANGQDYVQLSAPAPVNNRGVAFLDKMTVNGDIIITNDVGALDVSNGGTFNGNLTGTTAGNTYYNYHNNGEKLTINGDTNITSHGVQTFVRNADIDGDFNISSDGGFVDVGNAKITGDANITTTGVETAPGKYKHFVHVIGDTSVGGDLNVEASQNIHIGGYDSLNHLADGNLTVGGDFNAHSTNGHITTTINTTADKINYKSDTLNILSNDTATLKANEYKFESNGYIGGLQDYTSGTTNLTVDEQISSIMENYTYIPSTIASHAYMNVDGGNITKLNAPDGSKAYISSKSDLLVTGVNADDVNLTAPGKFITISGNDVHANNINIGNQTDKVKVDFPSRDFTLNYTNIRDGVVTTVQPDEEITYELTNGPTGYNTRDPRPANTTYLVGPGAPTPPIPPKDNPNPPIDENIKVIHNVPDQIASAPVNTPVAFAADLDDDEEDTGVRKNVDGSVTVVRAFPMMD